MPIGQIYKPNTLTEVYDSLVIGSGIGGLTVASILARYGQRVLVLERHYTPGGFTQTFRRKKFEWQTGLHYVGEVHRPHSVLRRIFDYITLGHLEWASLPSTYNRIVIGDQFYNHKAGADAFLEGLLTHFPQEEVALKRYLDLIFTVSKSSRPFFINRAFPADLAETNYEQMSMPFRAFSDRTTLSVLCDLTQNPELIAVLCGHFGDYGLPPAQSSFAIHAMVVRHYINGAGFPVGGSGNIARFVDPVITERGGEILLKADVSQIIINNGRAVGVRLQDGNDILAPTIISNAGIFNTFDRLLPASVRQQIDFDEKKKHLEPAMSHIGLYLGLNQTDQDLNLHPANIWSHPNNDLDGNTTRYLKDPEAPLPWHFITFPSAKDPSWQERHPGTATIEICSMAPYHHFQQWADSQWSKRPEGYQAYKKKLTTKMLKELYRLLPQVEGKIAHSEMSTPLTTRHFTGHQYGQILGLGHTPERFQQRWIRSETPVKNLYLTGQDLVTDGIGGAMYAGVIAASAILKQDVLSAIMSQPVL